MNNTQKGTNLGIGVLCVVNCFGYLKAKNSIANNPSYFMAEKRYSWSIHLLREQL